MRADADEVEQAAHLLDLDFLARRAGLLAALVRVGLGLVGNRARCLAGQRLGQHDPVVGVIALLEPGAGRARAARLAVGQRRFAQETLRQVLGELQLADAGLAVQQQRVRPGRAQRLQAVPVLGLPRIDHRVRPFAGGSERSQHAFELALDLGDRLAGVDDREAIRRLFGAAQVLGARAQEEGVAFRLRTCRAARAAPRRSLATSGGTSNRIVRSGWKPPCTQRSSVSSLSRGRPRPPPW